MNTEKEIIGALLSQFPSCEGHLNRFFESDAELLEPASGKLLFTTDEFSAEDFFYDRDPLLLGWNLAACTISDVLASGGTPRYFAHSLTLARDWDLSFVTRFAGGIASALKVAGTGFIGGDLGMSVQWKYTGICMGFSEKPVTRKGANPGDRIYITGKVGAGNLMAALNLFGGKENPEGEHLLKQIRFPVRSEESAFIRQYAGCCIDTSDGVLNALNTLAGINQLGYRVREIPYLHEGIQVCEKLSRPKAFLFAGECGEYELLFAVSKAEEKPMLEEARRKSLELTCLGEFTKETTRVLEEDNEQLNFTDYTISARGYPSINEYLTELTKYLIHAR